MRGSRTFRQGGMGWGWGTELTMFFFSFLSVVLLHRRQLTVSNCFSMGRGFVPVFLRKFSGWGGGGAGSDHALNALCTVKPALSGR